MPEQSSPEENDERAVLGRDESVRCSPDQRSGCAPAETPGLRSGASESLLHLFEALPEELRRQALTHASWVDHRAESYERLAFLGDVVLSLAVSTHLLPRFERYGAGRLTKVRAQAVSGPACAEVAVELGVPNRLRAAAPAALGRGAEVLVDSERVLSSVCEAIIGAAYLAFGIERVASAVVAAFAPALQEALDHPEDYKSLLQERLARRAAVVRYRTVEESGPPHERLFAVVAEVEHRAVGRGEGKTKKAAEQEAAAAALSNLRPDAEVPDQDAGPDAPRSNLRPDAEVPDQDAGPDAPRR